MSYSRIYADDFENLALVMMESGATPDELKSLIDDAVEVMERAKAEVGT